MVFLIILIILLCVAPWSDRSEEIYIVGSSLFNLNSMKNLAYIPNKLDKVQIEPLFNQSTPREPAQPQLDLRPSQDNQKNPKELTKT